MGRATEGDETEGDETEGVVKLGAAIGGAVIDAEDGSVTGGVIAGAVIAGAMIAGGLIAGEVARGDVIVGIETDGTFNEGPPGWSDKGRVLLVTPAGGARLSVVMPVCAGADVDWATVAADSNAKPIKPRRMRCLPGVRDISYTESGESRHAGSREGQQHHAGADQADGANMGGTEGLAEHEMADQGGRDIGDRGGRQSH